MWDGQLYRWERKETPTEGQKEDTTGRMSEETESGINSRYWWKENAQQEKCEWERVGIKKKWEKRNKAIEKAVNKPRVLGGRYSED